MMIKIVGFVRILKYVGGEIGDIVKHLIAPRFLSRCLKFGRLQTEISHTVGGCISFEPLGDPVPYDEDGHLDLIKVTAIQILGVEDYHGK